MYNNREELNFKRKLVSLLIRSLKAIIWGHTHTHKGKQITNHPLPMLLSYQKLVLAWQGHLARCSRVLASDANLPDFPS